MPYTDIGFTNTLERQESTSQQQSRELDSSQADLYLPEVTADKIVGGILQSVNGVIKIDLDNEVVTISDGGGSINEIGVLEDGTIGFLIKDKDENVIAKFTNTEMILRSKLGVLYTDFIAEQELTVDEAGIPITLRGRQSKGF